VEGDVDFKGHLRLQAKLSQTVTGVKSFFLKAVDPFFKKDGAGAVVPISITGTREHPTIGVTVFHKTIEKKLGAPESSSR
jgi:VCBS repeat-containing protein